MRSHLLLIGIVRSHLGCWGSAMSDDKPYGYAFVVLGKCDRIDVNIFLLIQNIAQYR
ncbi:hypothetical protein [Calothrix sp. PCC 7507]|uniref:hypothetical protein n=1 Tax=Calothrix sp. PCC 7507 TaxID=99598 RepID=UPI00030AB3F3|nr:hypothetical protein [Calothrix sp. PCC 7507]